MTCPYIRCPGFVKACVALFLASIAFFDSGCLVLTSKHLSKPLGPDQLVQLHATNEYPGWVFHRYFNSNDFNLDVCVLNSENRGQIDFWFYILPLPDFSYHGDKSKSILTVQIQIEPKAENVLFDPAHAFYSGTNIVHVAPARAWRVFSAPKYGNFRTSQYEMASKTTPVTTDTWFILEYVLNGNPDIPFDLFIEGCAVDGHGISLPRITFEPATINRFEFKLPY